MRRVLRALVMVGVALLAAVSLHAQERGGGPAPPLSAWASAPVDLTGYWVAVIGEDWRWRMVTPAQGDYASIPLTQAGKDLADTWNPAADTAAGEQCKSYGAPGLMRAPTRLHITWPDDDVLQVATDYGMQTRRLYFTAADAPSGEPSLQGRSIAQWQRAPAGRGGNAGPPPPFGAGTLNVVTTSLRPGYLRKNGVPYSGDTVLTEYWDVIVAPSGEHWLVVTSVVRDPRNLQTDWITSLHFKREPDGAKWKPSPCSAEW